MFYMFYLYHFSVKFIIKNFYFPPDGPLKSVWKLLIYLISQIKHYYLSLRVSVQCKVIALLAFYDALLDQLSSSLINSVKMVHMH